MIEFDQSTPLGRHAAAEHALSVHSKRFPDLLASTRALRACRNQAYREYTHSPHASVR